ncbi:hypothetical protein SDC9_154576 [bioreactor metagenome]|uniref:Uncharacterized protein n=1 Tax=bioreactor metagenome TaxID=1076179 RepID=A0A645F0N6_9ZZZZ
MPVSASPMPPDAIALFPVGFIIVLCPSVITVLYPFKSTIHLYFCAKLCAIPMRFCFISSIVNPVNLDISPKCGVIITLFFDSSNKCRFPLRTFNPSASITTGHVAFNKVSITSCNVVSLLPIPGPIAMQLLLFNNSLSFSVSLKCKVIASISLELKIGCISSSQHSVTSPAPLLTAPCVAIYEAPVNPLEPAIMTTLP